MVAKSGTLGIVPGQDFDIAKLDPAIAQALAKAPKTTLQRIAGWEKEGVAAGDWRLENGWAITTKAGLFGTDYVQRALIAMIGLYANRPQDSIYPVSNGPVVGQEYSGANSYLCHPLQQRRDASGQRLLVNHDVRRAVLLRGQPPQPL